MSLPSVKLWPGMKLRGFKLGVETSQASSSETGAPKWLSYLSIVEKDTLECVRWRILTQVGVVPEERVGQLAAGGGRAQRPMKVMPKEVLDRRPAHVDEAGVMGQLALEAIS